MSHTPTPWRAEGGAIFADPIVRGSIGLIAECCASEVEELYFELVNAPLPAEANAMHIIRCVNEREDLVNGVRMLLDAIGSISDSCTDTQWNAAVSAAQMALDKADA